MKKLLKLLSLGLFVALASCAMETNKVIGPAQKPPVGTPGEDVDTEINLTIPGGFSVMSTRALTDDQESAIEDAFILVFDDADRLDRAFLVTEDDITQSGKDGTIDVTLPSGEHKVAVVANASDLVISELADKTGESYTVVMAALTQTVSGKLHANEGFIPMWGETEMITITKDSEINIPLVRSLARVDVGVGTWSDTGWNGKNAQNEPIPFVITEVYVINPQDAFAVVPDAEKYADGESGEVPTIVGDLFGAEDSKSAFKYESTGDLRSTIYIPEADIFVTEEGEKGDDNHASRMALVVGGRYSGGEPTFYRVDFHNGTSFVNVLRNHLYRFSISGVKGQGANDVVEAYESNDNLITATVLDWDEIPFDNISVVGDAFMAITTDEMAWSGLGGAKLTTTIHTNIYDFGVYTDDTTRAAGDPLLTSADAVSAGATGVMAETAHFRYTLAKVADSNEDYTLSVSPRAYNVAASGAAFSESVSVVDDTELFAGAINLAVSQGFTPMEATYVPSTAGDVAIENSLGTLIWAGSNLQDNGVFAPAATDEGSLWQWGYPEAIEGAVSGGIVPISHSTVAPFGSWDVDPSTGLKAAADPCAPGWRVPTAREYADLIDAVTWDGTGGVLGTDDGGYTTATFEVGVGKGLTIISTGDSNRQLFIPNAGQRVFTGPTGRGVGMWLWSSTYNPSTAESWFLAGEAGNGPYISDHIGLTAFSIRCVRNVGGTAAATYAVSATSTDASGGTATVITPLVAAGQRARVSTTVNAGYTFAGWTSSDITIPETDAMNLSLDFTMPAGAVTLTASFATDFTPPGGIRFDLSGGTIEVAEVNLSGYQTWADSPTSEGALFQWGSKTAYYHPTNADGSTNPSYAASGSINPSTSYTNTNTTWPADQNPCPAGWRLPTAREIADLINKADSTTTGVGTADGTYTTVVYDNNTTSSTMDYLRITPKSGDTSKTLILPAVGQRDGSSSNAQGADGLYWTSEQESSYDTVGFDLYFTMGYNAGYLFDHNKPQTFSVRCVRSYYAPSPAGEFRIPGNGTVGDLIWAGSNLGAPGQFAANATDYGRLYQFSSAANPAGRSIGWVGADDTYPLESMAYGGIDTAGLSVTWFGWIYFPNYSWSAVGGWLPEDNPCPTGWRIPTHDEMVAFYQGVGGTGTSDSNIGTLITSPVAGLELTISSGPDSGKKIFFPVAGYRFAGEGQLSEVGSNGFYWSTSAGPSDATYAYFLHIGGGGAVTTKWDQSARMAYSVRCVRDAD